MIMECKKHSDWLRIKPVRPVNQQRRETRVRLDITVWPKYGFGNNAMRLTIIYSPKVDLCQSCSLLRGCLNYDQNKQNQNPTKYKNTPRNITEQHRIPILCIGIK